MRPFPFAVPRALPADSIEKAAFHTKKAALSLQYRVVGFPPHRSWIVGPRKTGSSPGSESSRGCVFPRFSSVTGMLRAALLFLTVAGPLRLHTEIPY